MDVRVIAYADPEALVSHACFTPYLSTLHICATAELKAVLASKYQEKNREVITGPIVSANWFLERLLQDWMYPETKLLQFTSLTQIIRRCREDCASGIEGYLRAFRLNQFEVLNAIRILQEAGVTPGDLRPSSPEEVLFLELWEGMEPSIREDMTSVNNLSLGKELRQLMMHESTEQYMDQLHERSPVVLHGFYYLTPIQHRVFSEMAKGGRPLVFANFFDERRPDRFEVVERFIHPKWGWPDRTEWHFISYSEDYRGEDTQILVYDRFNSFLADLESDVEQDTLMLSPRDKALNERIKDFHPAISEHRHFLSYPLGQFFLHLHNMWDEAEETIVLGGDSLYECFSSGWLTVDGKNARDYIAVLRDLLPYFSSCHTLEDWIKQSEHMQKLRDQVGAVFERYSGSDQNLRFHRMMENPLLRFSHFQVASEDLAAVIAFIKKLLDLATGLFGSGKEAVTVAEHFRKLRRLIDEGLGGMDLIEEEMRLVVELRQRLQRFQGNANSYLVQDLAQAIALYLGGDFENEDTVGIDREPCITRVKGMVALDSLLFDAKKVHLCAMDEDSFPAATSWIPWPLSKDWIQRSEVQNKHVQMLVELDDSAREIARYQMYIAESFAQELKLSWIHNWEDAELDPSIYLRLKQQDPIPRSASNALGAVVSTSPGVYEAEKALETLRQYPADAAAECILCPRRFLFSFLLNKQGYYCTDFHHGFLAGSLVSAMRKLTNRDVQEISAQIDALFPHWTALRKHELIDLGVTYADKASCQGWESYDGREYSNFRKAFQFLVESAKDSGGGRLQDAWRTFDGFDFRERMITELKRQFNHPMMEAMPSKVCRYCPHLEICAGGFYPIDDEMRSLQK